MQITAIMVAVCESSSSSSSSSVATGVILTLCSCVAYSFGNNIQRYALLQPEGSKIFFNLLNRNIAWFLGACIYFSANGIYAVALSFAPVSVLSVVFSLTIVTNAGCAWWFLGDKVPVMAIPGYVLILVGAILFSFMVEAEVCHFDADGLKDVMTNTSAIIFWVFLGLVIVGGIWFATWFERICPLEGEEKAGEENQETKGNDDTIEANVTGDGADAVKKETDPKLLLAARLLYPSSLGAMEAAGTLILKAVNSLFTTIITDEDSDGADQESTNAVGLWVGLCIVGFLLFIGIVGWLRVVYRRFEISGAFPVEFGFVTFASVIGGFAVYQDHQFVNGASAWVGVVFGALLILSGIGLVAFSSWRAQK